MATPIYSTTLWRATQTAPFIVLGLPFDDGNTYVIRDMVHWVDDGLFVTFKVYDQDGCVLWSVAYPGAQGQWEHWTGRQEYKSPFTLFWGIDGLAIPLVSSASLRISGYKFTS